ncbi:hypothetical protein HY251_10625 [bacterium]|nr:hypothetical protein [bacterium]
MLGEGNRALSFQLLQARGAALGQPVVVRLAFVCALVGYGAKVGFFPLHAWKADAYTATTPPAAGLLAGASVAASLVPILRFALIARAAGQEAFVDSLLRTVGAGSFLAATAFVIRERDIVRILAYTGIEQMGLCAAAFGLGAQGTRAGLLQLFGNAILKALAFGLAGVVARARGHSSIDLGKGISGSAPSLAAAYVVVIFAALGFPPFGLFTSELLMVGTAFSSGHEVLAALLALCLAIAFAAVAINALRAVFERADDQVPSWRFRKTLLVGTAISLTGSALAGSFMPRELFDSLLQVASGGTP